MTYKFIGNDSRSDDGHWAVIIYAFDKCSAVSILEQHLIECGKAGYQYRCQRVVGPILYSSVEVVHV